MGPVEDREICFGTVLDDPKQYPGLFLGSTSADPRVTVTLDPRRASFSLRRQRRFQPTIVRLGYAISAIISGNLPPCTPLKPFLLSVSLSDLFLKMFSCHCVFFSFLDDSYEYRGGGEEEGEVEKSIGRVREKSAEMPPYDCLLLVKPQVRKEALMDLVARVRMRV